MAQPLTREEGMPTLGFMHLTRDEITKLSPDERLALIAALWDSLDESHIPLTSAQQSELERRLASLEHDRDQGMTWEALRGELERRCP